jgi:HSP20 family protein
VALVRSDPFGEIERLFQQMWQPFDGHRQLRMPMDAIRKGDEFLIQMDLPGVDADSVDLTVEDNVLTVKVERPAPELEDDTQALVAERPYGTFTRQLVLGDQLDTERIEASYSDGVLTLRVPVAAHAQPRKISVSRGVEAAPEQKALAA